MDKQRKNEGGKTNGINKKYERKHFKRNNKLSTEVNKDRKPVCNVGMQANLKHSNGMAAWMDRFMS